MSPYKIVEEFEKRVAEYAGAAYAVAVNSCTNALFLSFVLRKMQWAMNKVVLPKYTYVGVAYAALNAGLLCEFKDIEWRGAYRIKPGIIDAARRFYRGMYEPGMLYCVSFHETKILNIGDGGMILTDDEDDMKVLKQMRFDGRTPGNSVFDDDFNLPGYHCHMKPDVAARGLMLMSGVEDYNEDLPETYPDLSQYPIFQEGYR